MMQDYLEELLEEQYEDYADDDDFLESIEF